LVDGSVDGIVDGFGDNGGAVGHHQRAAGGVATGVADRHNHVPPIAGAGRTRPA
jgi:hypothetical protein